MGEGVKEELLGTAHVNSSLFNVNIDPVSADIADSVTCEIFNLLFRTERASFFVPKTTIGGNRIILKTKLEGHTIASLKEYAGLYSPDQDDATVAKMPTNIFEICVRVQKQFTLPDGTLVPHVGSKAYTHAQTIVISIYPDNPLDPNGSGLPPVIIYKVSKFFVDWIFTKFMFEARKAKVLLFENWNWIFIASRRSSYC